MKILILGGGQIARAVDAATPSQHRSVSRTHAELDIRDDRAVANALAESQADWIVNAAAYTAVDLAEDHPAEAFAVNEFAVASLVRTCAIAGRRLLHLSTDFVFDGNSNRAYRPVDRPNPLSVYGASKFGGERHVLASERGIVLRTSWIYAAQGRNFVLTMLRLMRDKEGISVVCDQIGTPTSAASVARAIWGLIDAQAVGGVYHWSDLGVASWYDFAVAIQEESLARGLLERTIPVLPIPTSSYPTRAQRPPFSVLDCTATRTAIPTLAHHWRKNLRVMLDELRTA